MPSPALGDMKHFSHFTKVCVQLCVAAFTVFTLSCASQSEPQAAGFPANVDHSSWNTLLGKYVDDRGMVDYAAWKDSEEDRAALDAYLEQYAATEGDRAEGKTLGASAVNAYNAFAIRTILQNYPTESIRDLDEPFKAKSHNIGGQMLSLDDIEKGNAIPELGAIAHSIVVCCAKSCPPLQAKAYTADNIDSLAATATRKWLARDDLNDFDASEGEIAISEIFKWYKGDFEKAGGLREFLAKYAPDSAKDAARNAEIDYLDYNWALNAQ